MRLLNICLLGLFALTLASPADAATRRAEPRAAAKVSKPGAVPARAATAAPRQASTPRRPAAAMPPQAATLRPTVSRVPSVMRGASAGSVTASRGGNLRQTAKAGGRAIAQRGGSQGEAPVVAQRAPGMTAGGARLTSWQSGLPAADGYQRDCPTGTMSTLARGHDDIVRCMPL